MEFENSIKEGYAKRIPINIIRAKSLMKSSKQAIETAKLIQINEDSLKTIFRELYEALRQYCEAVGYFKGYKFNSHEVIANFLKEILKEDSLSIKFERYRKLRNGINYYGEDVKEETIKEGI